MYSLWFGVAMVTCFLGKSNRCMETCTGCLSTFGEIAPHPIF